MRFCWLMCIAAASFAAGSSTVSSALGEEPTAGGSVSLELAIVDVKGTALGDAEPTAAKVRELAQSGKADSSSLLKLSLLENLPATVQFSETVPVISGRTDFGGRGATNNVTMQNVGTMVQATARIEKSDQVLVELKAERSRIVPISPEADASMPGSTKTVQATVSTTIRQTSGEPTIVGSQTTGGGESQVHTFFILTARIPPTAQAAAQPAAVPVLKVFALSKAQASELVKTLQPMFEGQKIRLAADVRSNSLIVHGTPEVIEVAAALIERLDQP
jgi:type II secretory pathway component GspD/PulD (secretin)